MTDEIIQAIQAAIDAQFVAGKALGKLETLVALAMPKPTTPPPDTPPAES